MMTTTKSGRILGRVQLSADHGLSRMEDWEADVVAVQGGIGDWAAYVGAREWNDDAIASNGLKLYESEASPLFPYLNRKDYRR